VTQRSRLSEMVKKLRKYAAFWAIGAALGDKRLDELGAVEGLLEGMRVRGDIRYERPTVSPRDPPDCVAHTPAGDRVAMEVTDLIDEESVRRSQRDGLTAVAHTWTHAELLAKLDERLRSKDGKALKGGPFERYVVVITTDEPMLSPEPVETWLSAASFGPFSSIDEAYLLFSYFPNHLGRPYISLRITR